MDSENNEKMEIKGIRIGIIGLGLIGGSLARALRAKMGITPSIAVGRNEKVLRQALEDGNIAAFSTKITDIKDCDLVFVCVPVGRVFEIMDEISGFFKGIVTDVASTKASIAGYVGQNHPGMRYIGGHPMAGSEKVGYEASNANLFENAPYILCNSTADGSTRQDSGEVIMHRPEERHDLEIMKTIAAGIGARVVMMAPGEHDLAVGLVSHLPHIAAYALVDAVKSQNDDRLRTIAAGGFRDATRIASSDPDLWADILCDSGETVAGLLDRYIGSLTNLKQRLEEKDRGALLKVFESAKEYRDGMALPGKNKDGTVQLWVEIDDKPGMIARVSTIFSNAKINIRNIGIQDSREYEGGSLRITLSSEPDAVYGAKLLTDANMSVRIMS
ncbi:MAG: prephenate dehydrogenase/arogenate dehydrogenase family protein [Saccharofermentanales bacterium]